MTLCQQKEKTILITTHYIEEARHASVVGMMRKGKLLAQDAPDNLVNLPNCTTLEDAFLNLCFGQDDSNNKRRTRIKQDAESPDYADSNEEEVTEIKPFRCQCMSCHRLGSLLTKNLLRIWRNKLMMLLMFVLPAIQVYLFCFAIGPSPVGLPFGIVNDEVPLPCPPPAEEESCPAPEFVAFMESLKIGPETMFPNQEHFSFCDNDAMRAVVPDDLSCFLEGVFAKEDTFDISRYSTVEAALTATKSNAIWGFMHIKSNFSCVEIAKVMLPVNEIYREGQVVVTLDQSNHQIHLSMVNGIRKVYNNTLQDILRLCDQPQHYSATSIVEKEAIYGDETGEPDFREFIAPGMIILITYFLALSLTGEAFVTEKNDGLFDRAKVAGVLTVEIILSHILAFLLVLCVQVALTLTVVFAVFKIPLKGSIALAVLMTLAQGICGMFYGFMTSSLFQDHATAFQIAIASFFLGAFVSGTFWPVEAIPQPLRFVAWLLPNTFPTVAMRDIMAKGWGITRTTVIYGFVVSLAWTIVYMILSYLAIVFIK